MKVLQNIATTLASIGSALYIGLLAVRLDPTAPLLWPYSWLIWIVIPTGACLLLSFVAAAVDHRSRRRAAVKPSAPEIKRGKITVAVPWTEHAGIRSHRNLRTGDRKLVWVSNGAKAGTLQQAARGRWEVYDEDDNFLGTADNEQQGMDLVASSA